MNLKQEMDLAEYVTNHDLALCDSHPDFIVVLDRHQICPVCVPQRALGMVVGE